MSQALDRNLRTVLLAGCFTLVTVIGPSLSFAADAYQGKAIAERWCAGCHVVEREQKSPATDQAPPFASIARMPEFGANKLAILLLAPHPNMPKLALSRAEVANLADYILTLK
jgi:mono/diheme cytochrome c family protein